MGYNLNSVINLLEDHKFAYLERFIKQTKFDVDQIGTESGIAAIHYATGMDDESIAIQGTSVLLKFNANVNVQTKYDLVTPMHIAIEKNYPELLRLLLSSGGDLELKSIENETPISLAIEMKYHEIIDIIISHIKFKKAQKRRIDRNDKLPQNLNLSRLTPNRKTGCETPNSPYFVTIHKKAPPNQLISPEPDVIEISDSDEEELFEQAFIKKNRLARTSIRANLLELTKENLDQFTKSISKSDKNRKSLINNWCNNIRGKIKPQIFHKNIQEIEKVLSGFPEDTTYETAEEISLAMPLSNRVPSPERNIIIPEIIVTNCTDPSIQTPSENVLEEIPIIEIPESVPNNSQVIVLDESNFIRSPKNAKDSVVQLVEEYEHRDPEMGMKFFELKLVANNRLSSSSVNRIKNIAHNEERRTSIQSQSTITSTAFSVPLDYDTDTLREELKSFGFTPGPITKSTKRLYVRKLFRYKKKPERVPELDDNNLIKNFSLELQRTLKPDLQEKMIREYMNLEKEMETNIRNSEKKWRQGNAKKSFVYFLIDPRISQNLPGMAHSMQSHEIWRQFLTSIFYVGKGKSSRPFAHLYEAMELHNQQSDQVSEKTKDKKKVERILEIWKTQNGVVCLQTFHNIIPAEAFTREGAIIEAMGVRSLTNLKGGEFYGVVQGWPNRKRKCLGIYLLFKALKIFLEEGESQISPENL